MKPKKPIVLAAAAALAATLAVAGCDRNKRTEDEQITRSKFKLLNGSTRDTDASGKNIAVAPEPELNVDTRFAAGRLAETQGQLDCAVVQYEQALRLKPQHVASLYRLGICHTKMKAFEKAAAVWRKYIKATGDIASGYSNLGFCYEMAGDPRSAEAAYKEGIARDPGSVPCRTNYGLLLARNHRVAEAEEQFAAVLRPDEVRYNLAAVYEQQGAIAQAKRELKRAIEINPNNHEAAMRLANLPLD